MRRDPHVRSYHDSGPADVTQALRPRQRTVRRYGWPDEWDGDTKLLRSFMQEEGRGLYVLVCPVRGQDGDRYKAVVEAYYPSEIRPGFFERDMTPQQQADVRAGRLTVVNVLGEYWGRLEHPLTPMYVPGSIESYGEPRFTSLMELKRNNRNARRDLKRRATAAYHQQELQDEIEADEARVNEGLYRDADEAGEALADLIHWQSTPSSVGPSKRD